MILMITFQIFSWSRRSKRERRDRGQEHSVQCTVTVDGGFQLFTVGIPRFTSHVLMKPEYPYIQETLSWSLVGGGEFEALNIKLI